MSIFSILRAWQEEAQGHCGQECHGVHQVQGEHRVHGDHAWRRGVRRGQDDSRGTVQKFPLHRSSSGSVAGPLHDHCELVEVIYYVELSE